MQTITWWCETGKVGSEFEGEFEIESEATEEEIDEAVRSEVHNFISWGWCREGEERP